MTCVVRIIASGSPASRTRIYLDGIEISQYVTEYMVSASAVDEYPEVRLTLRARALVQLKESAVFARIEE